MTAKSISTADVFQHRRADFAGKSPLGLEVHILGAYGNIRGAQGLGYRLQINKRRTNCQCNAFARHLQSPGSKVLCQIYAGVTVGIHLPVTRYKRLSHKIPLFSS